MWIESYIETKYMTVLRNLVHKTRTSNKDTSRLLP